MTPRGIVEINGERYHPSDSKGRPYVRLRFQPAGSKRHRTVWAVKTGPRSYVVTDNMGDDTKDGGVQDGKRVEKMEIVIVGPNDKIIEQPAGFSFKYGELEVLPKERRS